MPRLATPCWLLALLAAPALGRQASWTRDAKPGNATAALEAPVVIPLSRVSAQTPTGEAAFYVARLAVGSPPQVFQVMFDTSSGDLVLPHKACRSKSCLAHRRFSPWDSSTALDVNADGKRLPGMAPGARLAKGRVTRDVVSVTFTQADLGEGTVKAVLVRDNVCLGPANGSAACVDMTVLGALTMQDTPFNGMPSDGIVGLGLESLAVGAMGSFLGQLFAGS